MSLAEPLDFALPELRFVPVESLVPHERQDERRLEALVHLIREQAVLRNPPVVAPFAPAAGGEPRYVVLDGANRSYAVRAAGLPHVVVQIVPYREPAVRLSTWCHALGDYTCEDFEQTMRAIPGLECHRQPLLHASAVLARREALAYVAFADGSAVTLHGGRDLHDRNALLTAI